MISVNHCFRCSSHWREREREGRQGFFLPPPNWFIIYRWASKWHLWWIRSRERRDELCKQESASVSMILGSGSEVCKLFLDLLFRHALSMSLTGERVLWNERSRNFCMYTLGLDGWEGRMNLFGSYSKTSPCSNTINWAETELISSLGQLWKYEGGTRSTKEEKERKSSRES